MLPLAPTPSAVAVKPAMTEGTPKVAQDKDGGLDEPAKGAEPDATKASSEKTVDVPVEAQSSSGRFLGQGGVARNVGSTSASAPKNEEV